MFYLAHVILAHIISFSFFTCQFLANIFRLGEFIYKSISSIFSKIGKFGNRVQLDSMAEMYWLLDEVCLRFTTVPTSPLVTPTLTCVSAASWCHDIFFCSVQLPSLISFPGFSRLLYLWLFPHTHTALHILLFSF